MRRLTHGTTSRGPRAIALIALLPSSRVPATAGAAVSGGLKQLAAAVSGDTAAHGLQRGPRTAERRQMACHQGRQERLPRLPRQGRDHRVHAEHDHGKLTRSPTITGCFTTTPPWHPTDDGCILATADADALERRRPPSRSARRPEPLRLDAHGFATVFKRATDGTLTYVVTLNLAGSTRIDTLPAVTVAPDGKTVYTAGPGGYGGILWICPPRHLRGRDTRRPRQHALRLHRRQRLQPATCRT